MVVLRPGARPVRSRAVLRLLPPSSVPDRPEDRPAPRGSPGPGSPLRAPDQLRPAPRDRLSGSALNRVEDEDRDVAVELLGVFVPARVLSHVLSPEVGALVSLSDPGA